MYKGKFDQKSRSGSNVQELLAQRNGTAPSSRQEASQPRKAAAPRPASPKMQETPAAPQKNVKPAKQGPRLGGVIFYTLYFLFILLVLGGTYLGMNWLNGWLADFEASQPTVKAQQVFDQLFADPDWAALYTSAGVTDTPYEGKDAYAAYMQVRTQGQELTYLETSAGLSGDKKFVIRLGSEKVASFTLVDKNVANGTTLENLSTIPDWELGTVEVFFSRDNSYRIAATDGHSITVNGVPLTDEHVIQIATTIAEDYLPSGVKAPRISTSEITDLFIQPDVKVFDQQGEEQEVIYDEASRTFIESTKTNTMPDDLKEFALKAAETYGLWMIEEVTNRATLAKYYDTTTDTYNALIKSTVMYTQRNKGYEFTDVVVRDYCRYNDDLFSVRIEFNLSVTRVDGTIKDFPYGKSMFFQQQEKDKWRCILSDNTDLTEPLGKVRLTFMHNGQVISSEFYRTDAKEIITPMITIPEGKVFSGWARRIEGDDGKIIMDLLYQPDSSSHVTIPAGSTIAPCTLYPLFEDGPEITVGEGQPTPDTAQGGA